METVPLSPFCQPWAGWWSCTQLVSQWSQAPALFKDTWVSCSGYPASPDQMWKACSPPPLFSIKFFFGFSFLFQHLGPVIPWQKTSLLCLGCATELLHCSVWWRRNNGLSPTLLSAVQEARQRPVTGCLQPASSPFSLLYTNPSVSPTSPWVIWVCICMWVMI